VRLPKITKSMKKYGLVSALFVVFCLNVVLAQKPEVPEIGYYFEKKAHQTKINKRAFKDLHPREKKNYDYTMFISEKNVSEYAKELNEYYEKEIQTLKEGFESTEAALKNCELNETDQILSELKYSIISGLGFAQKPLSKGIICKLIPSIREAETNEQWEEFHKSEIPAWTVNDLDGRAKLGVLLNVWAIKELLMELSESEYWRLPEVEDLAKINGYLNSKGLTAFDALAADKAKMDAIFTPYIWDSPGKDYYEMGLLPGGYRRDDIYYPKENQVKSCNFAITSNRLGLDFSDKIGISMLEENAKTIDYLIRDASEAAWGLNVILFRR
jgi:hypothetical protein